MGKIISNTFLEPIPFENEPIWYKNDSRYGYLVPIGEKVYFFTVDMDIVIYEEIENFKFVKE